MRRIMSACLLASLAPLPLVLAQAPSNPVTIQLGSRQGRAAPIRQGFAHTGGGNIDVAQPSPDTVVITMTGVAVAGAHPLKDSVATLQFDLDQSFEIAFDKAGTKKAKLTMEGRIIGLLRSHDKAGCAQQGPAYAAVLCGPAEILAVTLPPHSVSGGENVSVNDRRGPEGVAVVAGEYRLHQSFLVSTTHPHSFLCSKAASAEFAPDPALDPLWISHWEPFHGAIKKDFGFQITLRVAPENGPAEKK